MQNWDGHKGKNKIEEQVAPAISAGRKVSRALNEGADVCALALAQATEGRGAVAVAVVANDGVAIINLLVACPGRALKAENEATAEPLVLVVGQRGRLAVLGNAPARSGIPA